jgi:hypothetical protein
MTDDRNPRWQDMTPAERVRRHDQAEELGKLTGVTDDACYGRCEQYRDWFAHECRGVMHPEEAHNVLDMLLNRLAADLATGQVDQ